MLLQLTPTHACQKSHRWGLLCCTCETLDSKKVVQSWHCSSGTRRRQQESQKHMAERLASVCLVGEKQSMLEDCCLLNRNSS